MMLNIRIHLLEFIFLRISSFSYIDIETKAYKEISHIEFLIRTFKASHQNNLFFWNINKKKKSILYAFKDAANCMNQKESFSHCISFLGLPKTSYHKVYIISHSSRGWNFSSLFFFFF